MATISAEKNLDMLRKNKDGTYTKYNPKTKANLVKANVNGVAGSDVQTILQNLFQYADSGKKAVANAVAAKGVSASPTDAFSVLANKIGRISTGKKYASGTIERKFEEIKTYRISGLDFTPTLVIVQVKDGRRMFLYNNNPNFKLSEYLKFDYWSWDGVTKDGFSINSKSSNNACAINWFAVE